jgi:hypothetical protein
MPASVLGQPFIDLYGMVKRAEVIEQEDPAFTLRTLLTRA